MNLAEMFGFVQIRKAECRIKDYEKYRAYYCGLCRVLNERFGTAGRITLTYDMTFLVILLDSLYGGDHKTESRRCVMHPAKKHKEISCAASEYAADMNILLAYAKLADDKKDDKSVKAALLMGLYEKDTKKLSEKYPYQFKGIVRSLKRLEAIEKKDESGEAYEAAARAFGELMKVLFSYKRSAEPFLHDVQGMAYHLGCFIYLSDALEDLDKDIKNGNYNPLRTLYNREDFEEKIYALLYDEAAKCAWYFERLPVAEHGEILRNILYAGIWNRYDRRQEKEFGIKGDKDERRV